ncbi:hypothetical protein LV84_04139 [Algoriphagus ratkowskyi]|uniref:Uncharacterized protein n=1 Tax=Algoriphagus ratkowskyi TaxID=57028 RepID=A0A2W7R703_9BACT|nr:hypothetical protein [Algoriphagus ratkowskyi]PZX49949.1 hypothetical protein LV84_04139 [Algoriphagus ratkowskyi]TXD75520.1 hypothetical protein ESW18_20120 [Algoriphagus ratkowskyi]
MLGFLPEPSPSVLLLFDVWRNENEAYLLGSFLRYWTGLYPFVMIRTTVEKMVCETQTMVHVAIKSTSLPSAGRTGDLR